MVVGDSVVGLVVVDVTVVDPMVVVVTVVGPVVVVVDVVGPEVVGVTVVDPVVVVVTSSFSKRIKLLFAHVEPHTHRNRVSTCEGDTQDSLLDV